MKRGLPLLLLLVVVAVGCQRQARLVVNSEDERLREAEIAFWSGDYRRATLIYEAILETESEAARERSLFRLALIQGLQPPLAVEGDVESQVENYSERLAVEYPGSPLNADIERTLTLLSELAALRADREQRIRESEQGRAELEQIRDERAAFENEFERVSAELARIRDERTAFESVLEAALVREESPASGNPNQAWLLLDDEDSLRADLARLGEDLVRLSENYQNTPLAAEADLILSLLDEIRQLRQTRAIQLERIDGLVSQVELLREELEKLREADQRRRLSN